MHVRAFGIGDEEVLGAEPAELYVEAAVRGRGSGSDLGDEDSALLVRRLPGEPHGHMRDHARRRAAIADEGRRKPAAVGRRRFSRHFILARREAPLQGRRRQADGEE
jgi:hypothetical protein